MERKTTDRFWSKVAMKGPQECWEWTACRHPKGYGMFGVGGRNVKSHRFSWELHNGPIPVGQSVLHSCDNRACVNPAHLSLGTQTDNMRQMTARGRHGRGAPSGERHGRSKLTYADVQKLREEHATGQFTNAQLGARFGVGSAQVSRIANGLLWDKDPQTLQAKSYRPSTDKRPIPTPQERFWGRVEKEGPTGCWNWTARCNQDGYGCFSFHGITQGAHRVAWKIRYGSIPDGVQVLHRCDNRRCCNPSHLFLGSLNDNMQDRNRKGRQARLKGEANGCSKLTDEAVKRIISDYGSGKFTQRQLAAREGVSQPRVWAVLKGRTWRHITGGSPVTPPARQAVPFSPQQPLLQHLNRENEGVPHGD